PGDRQGAMLAIDVDAVAIRLQDKGAQLCVNTWNERMGGIASKSATLACARETWGGCIMDVLVVDVGGTHVKILATGQNAERELPSGPTLTAEQMVVGVKKLAEDWQYDAVTIGYPGPVINNRPLTGPWNLGPGWMGYNFEAAFACPVKVVNDAVMQALGSYEGGKMLFLGLGTGFGSTMIVDGIVEPMELGHLPYKRSTFEDYVGIRGYKRRGKKKWRQAVTDVIARLMAALEPEYVVLGGGNVKKLQELPPGCRAGDNANAFVGGFRLWQETSEGNSSTAGKVEA